MLRAATIALFLIRLAGLCHWAIVGVSSELCSLSLLAILSCVFICPGLLPVICPRSVSPRIARNCNPCLAKRERCGSVEHRLPERDDCSGGGLWGYGRACCTLLRVSDPVNEPNTPTTWCWRPNLQWVNTSLFSALKFNCWNIKYMELICRCLFLSSVAARALRLNFKPGCHLEFVTDSLTSLKRPSLLQEPICPAVTLKTDDASNS